MEIREVKVSKALNPTSINLGEYVINPYKGCAYSCLYCYVRFNRVTMRESRNWGEYLDVRINTPELLEKELSKKKPKRVLLGSTTECFGPYEKQFNIMGQILDILNRNKIYYSILTRSPIINDYIDKLEKGYCEGIYFTVNDYEISLKNMLEPKTPDFTLRNRVVNKLIDRGLPVIPYFSPVFPYISKFNDIFKSFPKADCVEFEGLNFNLGNISKVIEFIGKHCPDIGVLYNEMRYNESVYKRVWGSIKKDIIKEAIRHKKNHNTYIHRLHSYFENKY